MPALIFLLVIPIALSGLLAFGGVAGTSMPMAGSVFFVLLALLVFLAAIRLLRRV